MPNSGSQSWIAPFRSTFTPQLLEVEGGKMSYVDVGHGEPFLFLHGIPTWSFVYRHLMRALVPNFRCIAPDLIGFGLSDKPVDFPQTPYLHCKNVQQLIEHLDLDQITLVLHDFGGPIGMSYAVDHVPKIKQVVLFNTWLYDLTNDPQIEKAHRTMPGKMGHLLYVTTNGAPRMALSTVADKAKVSPEFIQAVNGPLESKDARECALKAARQIYEGGPFYNDIWLERDKVADLPMLLIWGMKDPVFGEKHLNRIWHEFPLADVHQVKDAGHFPMEENPPEVFAAVQQWLAGVRSRGIKLL